MRLQAFNAGPALLSKLERDEVKKLEKHLQPLDFSLDVNGLTESFKEGTREWLFKGVVDKWLALPPSDHHFRALMIQGGAGLGKSTIAAMLPDKSAADVLGQYFFKHDDQRWVSCCCARSGGLAL